MAKAKYADGINDPTAMGTTGTMSTGRVYYNDAEEPPTVRELLATLPEALFPKFILKRLFEDLETFRPQLEAAAARASLTLADAEALFVYTYELYEPTISPVAD